MRYLSNKRYWPALPFQQRPTALVTNAIIGGGDGPLNNGLLQVGDQIYTTTKWFIRDRYEYPRQAGQVMDSRFPYELHMFSEDTAGLQLVKVPEVRLTNFPNKKPPHDNRLTAPLWMTNKNTSIEYPSQFVNHSDNEIMPAAIINPYYYFLDKYYQQQLMSSYINSVMVPNNLTTVTQNSVFDNADQSINNNNFVQKNYTNLHLEVPNQLSTSISPVQNQRKVQFRLPHKSFRKVSTFQPFSFEEKCQNLLVTCSAL